MTIKHVSSYVGRMHAGRLRVSLCYIGMLFLPRYVLCSGLALHESKRRGGGFERDGVFVHGCSVVTMRRGNGRKIFLDTTGCLLQQQALYVKALYMRGCVFRTR